MGYISALTYYLLLLLLEKIMTMVVVVVMMNSIAECTPEDAENKDGRN